MILFFSQKCNLPCDNSVNKLSLLIGRTGQIDSRGLNALMAHKVGQKGNIIEFCQKVFGKTVPEGVGIHDLWVQAVPDREYLELSTYARWGDGSVKTAEEQGTGASADGGQPFLQFMNQSAGNIGTPPLSALGLPRRRWAIWDGLL